MTYKFGVFCMQDIKNASSQEESCDNVLSGATANSPITGLSLPDVQPLSTPAAAVEMNTQLLHMILQALLLKTVYLGR